MNQMGIFDGKKKFINNKPLRLIELFGGIEAQATALHELGVEFEHYKYVDFDKCAVKSANAMYGTNWETTDITKIKAIDLGVVETDKYDYIMTYSFPCQDLSLAGKGAGMAKGSDTRSGLLWEVERLLNGMTELPQVLLMENVPQVHGKKNIDSFNEWQDFLQRKGYKNYWQDLKAINFGIPQNRNRTFMVSLLGDYHYSFPKEIKLQCLGKDFIESEVDEKYYLSDRLLNYHIKRKNDNGHFGQFNPKFKDDLDIVRTIHNTGLNRTDDNFVVDDKQLNLRIRKFTPKECWRLMGFRDKLFDKAQAVNSNSQLYKQAGNSIVTTVLMAIFGELLDIDWQEKVEILLKNLTEKENE